LNPHFDEHVCQLQTIRFWIAEAGLGRQDLYDKIGSGRPPCDDLDARILDILDKSPCESAQSRAERPLIVPSTMLRHCITSFTSNRSIYIACRICWQTIHAKNERSMQELCCHSCTLPNMIAGIILRQNRDLIFRVEKSCL
jgi:hypothetical protein